jgi:hypothetical protein
MSVAACWSVLLLVSAQSAAQGTGAPMLVFGKDVYGTPVPQGGALPREIAISPEGPPLARGDFVEFSLLLKNPGRVPVELTFARYPAHPMLQIFSARLDGPGLNQLVDPAGPEVYAMMGAPEQYEKVSLPGGATLKFEEKIPLSRYEYRGAPEVSLLWRLLVPGKPLDGKATLQLPEANSIHAAARNGWKDDLKRMIAKGADVNAKDDNGTTALELAASAGDKECVEMLLEKKARLGLALLAAVNKDRIEIVRTLVQAGAPVNERYDEQKTALHWAAVNGRAEIARFLVQKGADVRAKDQWGHLPVELAHDPDTVAALKVPAK